MPVPLRYFLPLVSPFWGIFGLGDLTWRTLLGTILGESLKNAEQVKIAEMPCKLNVSLLRKIGWMSECYNFDFYRTMTKRIRFNT